MLFIYHLCNTEDMFSLVFLTSFLKFNEEDRNYSAVSMNGWSRCFVSSSALNIHCMVLVLGWGQLEPKIPMMPYNSLRKCRSRCRNWEITIRSRSNRPALLNRLIYASAIKKKYYQIHCISVLGCSQWHDTLKHLVSYRKSRQQHSSLYNMQYLRMAPEEQVQRRLPYVFVAAFFEDIQLCQAPKHFDAM